MRSIIPIISLILLSATVAYGETYLVRPDGTGDFRTIQAAIEAAESGDVIELADGTFTGEGNRGIDFLGKAITVQSSGGEPDSCVIDAQGIQRGIRFVSEEGYDSVLEGVTITGGYHSDKGAGIVIEASSPTIRNCVITDCGGCRYTGGGGIACIGGAPLFEDCVISDNETSTSATDYVGDGAGLLFIDAEPPLVRCVVDGNFVASGGSYCGDGGGLACIGGTATLIDCIIRMNEGHNGAMCTVNGVGIYCAEGCELLLLGCLFDGNISDSYTGSAVYLEGDCDLLAESCTFVGNVGSGSVVHCHDQATMSLTECLIAFNLCAYSWSDCDPLVAAVDGDSTILLTDCCIYGNEAGDWEEPIADQRYILCNMWADPMFCDMAVGDFSLHSNSPCLPDNNFCDAQIGAFGIGCGAVSATPGQVSLTRLEVDCHPNPFNPQTTITFSLERDEWAEIAVFDLTGKRLTALASRAFTAGNHTLTWNGRDAQGRAMPSGTYIVRLETESGVEARKVSLIR